MKRADLEKSTQYLHFQRNIFASLTFILAIGVILLTSLLFFKRERVIITPPFIEKSFWVEGNKVSPTYLEQFGYFLGQLLLSKSAHSAPSQRTLLLRHSDPQYVGALRKKLIEEENLLKKQNASYTFFPITVHVDPEKNEVLLEGDRLFFVGGKQVSSAREKYLLSFQHSGSRMLLTGISSPQKGKL